MNSHLCIFRRTMVWRVWTENMKNYYGNALWEMLWCAFSLFKIIKCFKLIFCSCFEWMKDVPLSKCQRKKPEKNKNEIRNTTWMRVVCSFSIFWGIVSSDEKQKLTDFVEVKKKTDETVNIINGNEFIRYTSISSLARCLRQLQWVA